MVTKNLKQRIFWGIAIKSPSLDKLCSPKVYQRLKCRDDMTKFMDI